MNIADIPYPRCLFCGDEIFFTEWFDSWLSIGEGEVPSHCEAFPEPAAGQELGHYPSTISVIECLRVIEEVTR